MFFFIGGLQPKTVNLGKQNMACPECGSFDVYLKRVDHYISLFFIPLFPVKRGMPFLICNACNSIFEQNAAIKKAASAQRLQTCPSCGRPTKDDFLYCPYCGKRLPRN